jgi:prolyl-tRNA editing enzyme YbaK/EbsC (Cys-tRNA(Pro) deacylase)
LGREQDILEFSVSSATVELAAQAVGVEGARIAKTLAFADKEGGCLLVVAAGDGKISNRRFKDTFGFKAKMMAHDQTAEMTGHAVGGVCPFALPESVQVYCDESLLRFETVFPAAGSSNSAVEMTPQELYDISGAKAWVKVCDLPVTE